MMILTVSRSSGEPSKSDARANTWAYGSDLLLLIRSQEPVTFESAGSMSWISCAMSCNPISGGRSRVQLELSGDDGLDINGESDQIKAAVGKLIENAMGIPQGSTVAVSVKRSQEGGHASVSVIDRGVVYRRPNKSACSSVSIVAASRTADEHGIGLGLAIVKHVALTHHGNVTVWSVPGQGEHVYDVAACAGHSDSLNLRT